MPGSLPSRTTGQTGKLHTIEAVDLGRAVDIRLGLEPHGQIRALSGSILCPIARVSFLLPGS